MRHPKPSITSYLAANDLGPTWQHEVKWLRNPIEYHSADALLAIINDILDFSKIEVADTDRPAFGWADRLINEHDEPLKEIADNEGDWLGS